jgi:UDP-N-acetylmuramate dehydrogenase
LRQNPEPFVPFIFNFGIGVKNTSNNFGIGTMNIKKLLPEVQEDVLLAPYTTFKIGGKAKYFFIAKTKEDIVKAIKAAQQGGVLFFVLAGGSNVLFPDNGFDGLIIKIQNSKSSLARGGQKIQNSVIRVEAGAKLADIVNLARQAGLSGLEWAAGIPGSIGGAVRGNAGAFDASMADIIKEVEALDISQSGGQSSAFSAEDCEFDYRNSIFKKSKDLIILSVELQLQKGNKKEIEKQMEEHKNYRKKHHPLEFPSAGSIFKNPRVESLSSVRLPAHPFPILPARAGKGEIPAGFLIEKCGLKGKKIGDAQISEKHCNFIINLGKAKASDVLQLIDLVQKTAKKKFNIDLEKEIVVL